MQEIEDYKFLEKLTLEMGHRGAKIIPAGEVVLEDRVRLKCMTGCPHYGQCLRCPPYAPSVDEFRKMLNDYKFAMIIKVKPLDMSEELKLKYKMENKGKKSVRLWNNYQDVDKISSMVFQDFSDHYKNSLMDLLELERAAFNRGYALATAFFGGKCMLCEECDVKTGICRNPMIARFAAEAVGINLIKTAENAGMELKFNSESDPTPMAILLID